MAIDGVLLAGGDQPKRGIILLNTSLMRQKNNNRLEGKMRSEAQDGWERERLIFPLQRATRQTAKND